MQARQASPSRLGDGDASADTSICAGSGHVDADSLAVALGLWFATTTAILIAETRLVHRIAKFRFYNIWRVLPVVHVLAARSHWRNSL